MAIFLPSCGGSVPPAPNSVSEKAVELPRSRHSISGKIWDISSGAGDIRVELYQGTVELRHVAELLGEFERKYVELAARSGGAWAKKYADSAQEIAQLRRGAPDSPVPLKLLRPLRFGCSDAPMRLTSDPLYAAFRSTRVAECLRFPAGVYTFADLPAGDYVLVATQTNPERSLEWVLPLTLNGSNVTCDLTEKNAYRLSLSGQ